MKNNITISVLTIVLVSGIVCSCDVKVNTDDIVQSRHEIILSTSIAKPDVKASYQQTNTQLIAGETVNVWIDEIGAGSIPLYENCILTANGHGNLSAGIPMYYPQNSNAIDIFALHSNADIVDRAFPDTKLIHSVSASQRNLDSYVWSDLLYASRSNVQNTPDEVHIVFYHLLSKVQVALRLDDGLSAADISGIMIRNTVTDAWFRLDKEIAPAEIEVSPDGAVSDISIGTDISSDFDNPSYNDAIIVPQTVAAGSAFIVVELKDGTRLAYLLDRDTDFESGYCYQYHIIITRDEIKVTSQVVDWIPGGVVSGEADIVVP